MTRIGIFNLVPSWEMQNFAGMPEDQLSALPAEIRTMVVAGAMMTNGGAGPNGGGMMQPGTGMNMNGAMLNQIMGMNGMMNPMMDMGVGMNGDMGMGMGAAGPGMPMGSGMGGGPGPGMMQDGGGPGMGVGGGPQGGTPAPEQTQVPMGMGVGDGFGAGGGGPGMMGMGMGGEFPMQVRVVFAPGEVDDARHDNAYDPYQLIILIYFLLFPGPLSFFRIQALWAHRCIPTWKAAALPAQLRLHPLEEAPQYSFEDAVSLKAWACVGSVRFSHRAEEVRNSTFRFFFENPKPTKF